MTPTPPRRRRPIRIAELRGIARLATQATTGVTAISEGLHQAIWRTLGMPGGETEGRTRGITGFVYRSIDRVTRVVGGGVDLALAQLQPLLDPAHADGYDGPARIAMISALNGVIGDHLCADGNPLALSMSLRRRGALLDAQSLPMLPDASGKVLLLLHGLCMNDLQWHGTHEGEVVDHGEALAAALGYTPVALRYNSGLHIHQNGRELAQRLEQWLASWPVPVTELSIVGHSMGGLVARSAVQQANELGLRWPQRLRHLAFLGTPHHGAPLERAGHGLDLLLGSMRYSAPFAMLGQLRSAGITDLRHGVVRAEDHAGRDRFGRDAMQRTPLPLPAGVQCHTIAATTAGEPGLLADHLIGDGLVPLRSALGEHDAAEHRLDFAPASRHIAYRTGHIELLRRPEISAQLLRWLGT